MSTKSMPSSGRRLSVRIASALSRGGPQTRGPAMRIAPKPRRWIPMSPPILNEPDLLASSLTIIRLSSALPTRRNQSGALA